jgi:hypothetical protein
MNHIEVNLEHERIMVDLFYNPLQKTQPNYILACISFNKPETNNSLKSASENHRRRATRKSGGLLRKLKRMIN